MMPDWHNNSILKEQSNVSILNRPNQDETYFGYKTTYNFTHNKWLSVDNVE